MTNHELDTITALREALPALDKHLADDIAGIIRGLRTDLDRLNGIQDEHRDLVTRHVDCVRHHADTFSGDEAREIIKTLSAAFHSPLRVPILVLPRDIELTAADDDDLAAIGLQRKEPA